MYDRLTSWGCCSLCSRHQSASPMHFILCVFWKFIWTISIRFQFTAHFYHYFMIYFFFGLNITKIFLNYLSLLHAICRKNRLPSCFWFLSELCLPKIRQKWIENESGKTIFLDYLFQDLFLHKTLKVLYYIIR